MNKYKYIVSEKLKADIDKIVAKMRENLFELNSVMGEIQGLDPSSVGFMRHLATILDSGLDIPKLHMLGDTIYDNFCEELEVTDLESGEFVTEWDTGEVVTCSCKFNRKTGVILFDGRPTNRAPKGTMTDEYVQPDEDEEERLGVCPECHEHLMVTVMVPDEVGSGLHEAKECPDKHNH